MTATDLPYTEDRNATPADPALLLRIGQDGSNSMSGCMPPADIPALLRQLADTIAAQLRQPDPEFPATWAGGHALVIEYGDEELHGRCQCGERFTPQRPDKPIDRFAGPWERHVMTLGR
ncbi:hypothetical protein V2S66_31580 [Streptomyces sp. V4-01]|uniref:Uncharacterized protein n=1 Tax=Actinacidiphila polyblastidii TaxID=3110430 RepID=A0ABU7PKZ2_9ACTN|nr:hypothetical protein [Streptomyces sp. V4-01]